MTIPAFQKKILSWYRRNGRHDLPWRPPSLKLRSDGSVDPYKILVSEVMLQQTQVDRVIPKFQSFSKKFPTAATLVRASTRDLLSEWKGLGYNRRALYLRRAAQKIERDFCGVFPRDPSLVEQLPGVGRYTARAVAAFAFDAPHVCIETNIRRIFLHYFFPGKQGVLDMEILPLVEKALWKKSPRLWYGALMDYGALAMKGVKNPNTRSRHYAHQSRFEGSRRYARAKLLDLAIRAKEGVTKHDIIRLFGTDPHLEPYRDQGQISDILSTLYREGFLEESRGKWKIPVR